VERAQEPKPRSYLLNLTVCTRNMAVWALWFSCRAQTRLSESPTVGQGIWLPSELSRIADIFIHILQARTTAFFTSARFQLVTRQVSESWLANR
jgi:hypothetical protein